MGLFSRLFQAKKEILREEVSVEELPSWFKQKTAEKIATMKSSIQEKFARIEQERKQALQALAALQQAKLRNESIPARAKHVMEGNRRTYILQVELFLKSLNFPKEIHLQDIKEFLEAFEEKLADFTKNSARSYYILQEFFKDESKEVAKRMRNIDALARELLQEEYGKIVEISDSIVALHRIRKENTQILLQLKEEKEKQQGIVDLIEKNNQEISRFKESKQFARIQELRQKLAEEEQISRKTEDSIVQLFSPLEPGMKKYAKISLDHDALLQQYMENPVHALLADSTVTILLALRKMQESIQQNAIELKEDKKEKILLHLPQLTQEKVQDLVAMVTQQRNRIAELKKAIQEDAILHRIQELEYRNQHLKDKLTKVEESILKLEKNIDQEQTERLKQEIAEKMKEVLQIEVQIHESS